MNQIRKLKAQVNMRRQGSALLVTLLTMALLMVVVLTFVVMVRLELRNVIEHQNLILSRANARLGAELAVAHLQSVSGPDTRVTAPVLSGAGIPNVQWIGQAVDAAAHRALAGGGLELNPDYARATGYLISGDSFDPSTFQPFAAGQVRPDHALLVGPGSVASLRDRNGDGVPDDYVAAPLVSVGGPSPGAFAWWIGDEGLKAQVNVMDPLDENPHMDAGQRARARKSTAQRTGSEVVLSGYTPDNPVHNQILARSMNLEHLNLVSGNELGPTAARDHFHDISMQSLGLPSNTRRGGLKRDLTAVMREAEANGGTVYSGGAQWTQLMSFQAERIARWRAETQALETAGRLGAAAGADRHQNALQAITLRADQADSRLNTRIFPPMSDLHVQWDQGGAPWEQLITWPTLRQRRGTSALEPQGRWQETMEVSPVIAKVAIAAYATVNYPEASLHLVPTVVLWNPYNRPMSIPANTRMAVSYSQGDLKFLMRLRVSHSQWNLDHVAYSGNPEMTPSDFAHVPRSARTGGSLLFTPTFEFRWNPDGSGTYRDQFIFTFRSRTGGANLLIEPGQARIFTMHQHLDVTPGTAGGSFAPLAELREGIPAVPGQFGYQLRENLEDQMDDGQRSVRASHGGTFGGGLYTFTAHREPIRGYNIWHPESKGGGNFARPPQAMPYPFPLSHPDNEVPGTPRRLTGPGPGGNLMYAAADAPPDAICINKHYLRGWEIEEIGLELGGMGNQGTRTFGGVAIRLDQGPGTMELVDIFNLNGTLPPGLTHSRLSDVDNTSINLQTGLRFQDTAVQLSVPAEPTPANSTTHLEYSLPLWGLSYGLRLPENAYNYDVSSGASRGGVGGSLAAPIRWMVDMNPVAPHPGRDPAGRSTTSSQINNSPLVTSKAGFQSPAAYSGGFFMQSDRLGNLVMSTPDDLNQFIGATDSANPDWSGGPPRAVIYEIPENSGDIVSVASLMQAPLTPTSHALMPQPTGLPGPWTSGFSVTSRSLLPYWLNRSTTNYGFMKPAHAIGNSRAHLMVRRDMAVQSFYPSLSFPDPASHGQTIPYAASVNPLRIFYGLFQGSGLHRDPPGSFFPGYDSSWVYNEVLWDDFFFTPRANTRQAWRGGIHPDDDPGDGVDRDFTASAQNMLIQGAFNINSVSIPAWAALLTSMMNVEVGPDDGPLDTAAFTRFLDPMERALDDAADDYYSAPAYGGYRRLRAEEIWNDGGTPDDFSDDTGLAAEIVRQVRARGPFLSLSDFVNRALLPANLDPQGLGLAGALQTAIDRSGVNRMMGGGGDSLSWIDANTEMDHPWSWSNVPDSAFQGLSPDNLGGWTTDPVSGDPVLAAGVARNAGSSGEMTQADVLARIGAVLRPRSDTFIIRAAGLLGDPASPGGQAWCEMVVQRSPDFVDPAANRPGDSMDSLNWVNRQFGRRYEIISFRWLAQEEL
jgi:hypothetical protein